MIPFHQCGSRSGKHCGRLPSSDLPNSYWFSYTAKIHFRLISKEEEGNFWAKLQLELSTFNITILAGLWRMPNAGPNITCCLRFCGAFIYDVTSMSNMEEPSAKITHSWMTASQSTASEMHVLWLSSSSNKQSDVLLLVLVRQEGCSLEPSEAHQKPPE